jgi:hypothetical protein
LAVHLLLIFVHTLLCHQEEAERQKQRAAKREAALLQQQQQREEEQMRKDEQIKIAMAKVCQNLFLVHDIASLKISTLAVDATEGRGATYRKRKVAQGSSRKEQGSCRKTYQIHAEAWPLEPTCQHVYYGCVRLPS